jgi:pimeloyl-ACP methyl ester carboxylesterase
VREVEVGGLRITYERAGTGPPLVFLHGYVGDGPATWRPQLDGLRDDFTLVAWDAPGAGGSSDPPESFGMAGYADALAGFIAGLGLDTPHVAGISFGGALALELYRRHPSVPRTLVLASAYAGWGGSLPAEVADQRLRQAHVLAGLSPDEFAGTLLPTMFSEGTPQESVEAFGASMRAFHPAGFRAMANASAEDLRDVLPTSPSRPCSSTAPRTSEPPSPWPGTSKPRSRPRPSSSSPARAMSATSKPQRSSTRWFGRSSSVP